MGNSNEKNREEEPEVTLTLHFGRGVKAAELRTEWEEFLASKGAHYGICSEGECGEN